MIAISDAGKLHHLRPDLPSDQRMKTFELLGVHGVEVNAKPCVWRFIRFSPKEYCFADTILLM